MCIRVPNWCLILLALLFASPAWAASDFVVEPSRDGNVLRFTHAEVAFAAGHRAPKSGWERRALPALELNEEAVSKSGKTLVWFRSRFDLPAPEPLAIKMDHVSERYVLTLNGVTISRNYADETSQIFSWNRPWMTTLPPELLRKTGNELILRIDTNLDGFNLGLGELMVGPDRQIRDHYDQRLFWQTTMPAVINMMLLIVAVMAIVIWVQRPSGMEVFWFGVAGALWWFSNLLFYIQAPPFPAKLFWDLSVYALFGLMVPLYAFLVTFFKLPNRNVLIVRVFVLIAALIALRSVLLSLHLADTICYVISAMLGPATLYVLALECWRHREPIHIAMLSAFAVVYATLLHDFALAQGVWQGLAIYVQPYGSIVVFTAWGTAQWFKMMAAMNEVEALNQTLETKVVKATMELAQSEAVRRKLEVSSAVEKERERLMFEIHDGIGSSLVTAITVAQNQNESPGTIQVLKRSLMDLRLAVDSLDGIEGDVPLLLASLRYRMEPDLALAGLSLDWKVAACPPLRWLDAAGALHVLRILQEAVSNVMGHAEANLITVGCRLQTQFHRKGILITIADDGVGMGGATETSGKGLANMRARANSLGGTFAFESIHPNGTRLSIWLPVQIEASGNNTDQI
jgi:signal transduction histidine kinase